MQFATFWAAFYNSLFAELLLMTLKPFTNQDNTFACLCHQRAVSYFFSAGVYLPLLSPAAMGKSFQRPRDRTPPSSSAWLNTCSRKWPGRSLTQRWNKLESTVGNLRPFFHLLTDKMVRPVFRKERPSIASMSYATSKHKGAEFSSHKYNCKLGELLRENTFAENQHMARIKI